MSGKLVIHIAGAMLILSGCAPELKHPTRVCPGKQSASQSLDSLRLTSESVLPLKATGRCVARFYVENKEHHESFPVTLWVNPPAQIRLHGDVFLNPRGIVLGSNEREFWLAIKPKEISTYHWGLWSEQNSSQSIIINPKILLEAIGIVGVGGFDPIYSIIGDITPEGGDAVVDYLDLAEFTNHWLETSTSPDWNPECDMAPQPTPDEKVDFMDFAVLAEHWKEDWSLSNEGVFDVLTKRNGQGRTIKKVYIHSCDYRVFKIEYFNVDGEVMTVAELYKYKEMSREFFVPRVIKIITYAQEGREDSIIITLKSVKPDKFDKKKQDFYFNRRELKGFKHIYRIIDGRMIEQPE